MRKQSEINQAMNILRKKGDAVSLEQVSVLTDRLNERKVFNKYLMETAEADRDETLYYACRDASRFICGELSLAELVPDYKELYFTSSLQKEIDTDSDSVTLMRSDFLELIHRIDRLERLAGIRRKPVVVIKPKEMPAGIDMKDMMRLTETCLYLGRTQSTVRTLMKRGLLHAYRKGKNTYYSKSEIDKNIKKIREEE